MQTTTLSMSNMHNFGELFPNLLRARRQSFIVRNRWELPEADGMEFDQYDTPASRWIAVHEGTEVLAGVRLTPTTARCGMYTYMIRDAQRGLIEGIPSNLLDFEAPVDPNIWESSRVFVAENVPAKSRRSVHLGLMTELIRSSRDLNAIQVLGLVPAVWPRWIGRLGLEAQPGGPVMEIDGVETQVAVMTLSRTEEKEQLKPPFSRIPRSKILDYAEARRTGNLSLAESSVPSISASRDL